MKLSRYMLALGALFAHNMFNDFIYCKFLCPLYGIHYILIFLYSKNSPLFPGPCRFIDFHVHRPTTALNKMKFWKDVKTSAIACI